MRLVKHQKRPINDELYNAAYENQDNQKIIQAVLAKYRKNLDRDTLKMCGLHALWRCLQYHQEDFHTKFTSSLWRFVHWECKKEVQSLARSKYKPVELFDIPVECEVVSIFTDIDNLLEKEDSDIIKLRFVDGMTLREIGRKFGYTKEAARQKLSQALKQVKQMVYNVEEG